MIIHNMKNPPVHPTLESMPVARTADDVTYHDVTHTPGISLLDYFAGLAMQGLVSKVKDFQEQCLFGLLAVDSYRLARAMLEERAKPENQL